MPVTDESRKRSLDGDRRNVAPEWTIVFEDASALCGVMMASLAIMQRAILKIEREDSGQYMLMVDGCDPSHASYLSARIQVDARFNSVSPPKSFSVCIDCNHVITAINNSSCAHGVLDMEGHPESAQVHLRMHDPDQRASETVAKLSTFVDAPPQDDLIPIDYTMELEIDLVRLKENLKAAGKVHAEHLRMRVFLSSAGDRQRSLVIFSIKGDYESDQKYFHETSMDDDGSLRVRAAQDGSSEDHFDTTGMDPEFEGVYPVDKLNAFVKNLSCRMIKAKIMQDRPLMFVHRLGSDSESQVRFLVAATISEDA